MSKPEKQQKSSVSILRRLWWHCAGANPEILSRNDCQTERGKQEAIAIMLFLTASTSALSAFYALYIVFASVPVAVGLGCFWGLNIYNLDRFFILSAKKKRNHFFGQLKVLTPRLALAGVLAVGISKPLELKMFESNIKEVILKEETTKFQGEIQEIDSEIKSLHSELQEKDKYYKEQLISANPEKKAQAPRTAAEIDDIKSTLKKKQQQLDKSKNLRSNPQLPHIGLSKQLEILEKLAETDPIIDKINLFITLLFVMIEISPILGKLMSEYSAYDAAIEAIEGKSIYYHTQHLADAKQEIDEQIENKRKVREAVRANTRERIEEFLTHQFTVVLEETTQSADLAEIRKNIVKLIATNIENEMMKQFSQIKMTGVEIEEQLNQIKADILNNKLRNKVAHVVTEAEVDRLFKDLEPLKKFGQDYESN
ncbi:hypothetical protein NIES2100_41940 [Calothrix sp. NIES-2100]|uniref:DUF4407 domain-containing protein n=1 Tax=Calothrix sp. NIES-2100 TaxID=1954172 RepID=UPI000B610859|nr:hypothetical protein NIES2100_41940 [Calothrix sp. NIES-2100]